MESKLTLDNGETVTLTKECPSCNGTGEDTSEFKRPNGRCYSCGGEKSVPNENGKILVSFVKRYCFERRKA